MKRKDVIERGGKVKEKQVRQKASVVKRYCKQADIRDLRPERPGILYV